MDVAQRRLVIRKTYGQYLTMMSLMIGAAGKASANNGAWFALGLLVLFSNLLAATTYLHIWANRWIWGFFVTTGAIGPSIVLNIVSAYEITRYFPIGIALAGGVYAWLFDDAEMVDNRARAHAHADDDDDVDV